MDVLYSNSTTTNKKDGIPNGVPFIFCLQRNLVMLLHLHQFHDLLYQEDQDTCILLQQESVVQTVYQKPDQLKVSVK